MMNIETQFTQLRLHGMSRTWQVLLETRGHLELSLDEGLEILLQAEQQDREHKRFERLVKNAGFRYQASIEELQLDASRGIDKALITTLATGNYIYKGESVLITGPTGCGKSFLASALGHQACVQGYKLHTSIFRNSCKKSKWHVSKEPIINSLKNYPKPIYSYWMILA